MRYTDSCLNELRIVRRPAEHILQQRWQVIEIVDRIVERVRYEWRDVPIVDEKEADVLEGPP